MAPIFKTNHRAQWSETNDYFGHSFDKSQKLTNQNWQKFLRLTANDIRAKLTNQFSRKRLITFDWKQNYHLTLMMTSAQVVETLVNVTDNSPFQDYAHPDDHTTRSTRFTIALINRLHVVVLPKSRDHNGALLGGMIFLYNQANDVPFCLTICTSLYIQCSSLFNLTLTTAILFGAIVVKLYQTGFKSSRTVPLVCWHSRVMMLMPIAY